MLRKIAYLLSSLAFLVLCQAMRTILLFLQIKQNFMAPQPDRIYRQVEKTMLQGSTRRGGS